MNFETTRTEILGRCNVGRIVTSPAQGALTAQRTRLGLVRTPTAAIRYCIDARGRGRAARTTTTTTRRRSPTTTASGRIIDCGTTCRCETRPSIRRRTYDITYRAPSGDYTDFYSSREHAHERRDHVPGGGRMRRRTIIGYTFRLANHGRASSAHVADDYRRTAPSSSSTSTMMARRCAGGTIYDDLAGGSCRIRQNPRAGSAYTTDEYARFSNRRVAFFRGGATRTSTTRTTPPPPRDGDGWCDDERERDKRDREADDVGGGAG